MAAGTAGGAPPNPSAELLHRIALSTLGLAILVHSVPAALLSAGQILLLGWGAVFPANSAGRVNAALEWSILAIRIGLGAYLTLGSRALVAALQRSWQVTRTHRLGVSAKQPGTSRD